MNHASKLATNAAKVGFISLGCPKALVDSERILTQLRTEGYQITPHCEDAGIVIGEALQENGRVPVTGCLGGCKRAARRVAVYQCLWRRSEISD